MLRQAGNVRYWCIAYDVTCKACGKVLLRYLAICISMWHIVAHSGTHTSTALLLCVGWPIAAHIAKTHKVCPITHTKHTVFSN